MSTDMDRDELLQTARMTRLQLEEKEEERLGEAVLQMLDHFAKLEELDVRDLPPTTHVLLTENRTRADTCQPNPETGPLLDNAPEREGRFITIPNVL